MVTFKKILRGIFSRFKDPVFIIALVVAGVALFISKLDNYYISDINLKIKIDGVEVSDVKYRDNIFELNCKVRGKGYNVIMADIRTITIDPEPFITINESGQYNVDMNIFEEEVSRALEGIELITMYNKRIPLKRVIRFHKQVPVINKIMVDGGGQYMQVGETIFEPSKVWISGDEQLISMINSVSTDDLVVVAARDNFSGKVVLKNIPKVEFSETDIYYDIKMRRYTEYVKDNINVDIISKDNRVNYILSPASISVRYNIIDSYHEDTPLDSIKFYVDLSKGNIDNNYIIKHTTLPEGVEINRMSDVYITVLKQK